MKWAVAELLGQCSGLDWSDQNRLKYIDPYLVWFDLTGFGGVQAPGQAQNLIPTMVDYRKGSEFRSKAWRRDEIEALCLALQKRELTRFELAVPTLNPDGFQSPVRRSALQERLPKSDDAVADRKAVIGFIDYGCAFAHRQFRVWDGGRRSLKTRVAALWDQAHMAGSAVDPPPGRLPLHWSFSGAFPYGAETLRGQCIEGKTLDLDGYIAQWAPHGQLDEGCCYEFSNYRSVLKRATHGTHMMDIATGYPSPLAGINGLRPDGAAPHDADIIFVQLPRQLNGRQVGGMLRANVYDGVRYIVERAGPKADVVINLSYGGYGGPHDGTSVLEQAMDWYLAKERKKNPQRQLHLVIPSGNSHDMRMHAVAAIPAGGSSRFLLDTMPEDPTDSFVEVWFPPQAKAMQVRLLPPDGSPPGAWVAAGETGAYMRDSAVVAAVVHAERVCQSDRGSMALVAFAPSQFGGARRACPYGRWSIEVCNDDKSGDASVEVHAWCERDDAAFGTEGVPRQSSFVNGMDTDAKVDSTHTLNSFAHGKKSIVVGGYVMGKTPQVAAYSGTGPGRHIVRDRSAAATTELRGPQVLAPSDESAINPGFAAAAVLGTDKIRLAGTSVAAAFTTRRIVEDGFKFSMPAAPGRARRDSPGASKHDEDLLRPERRPIS